MGHSARRPAASIIATAMRLEPGISQAEPELNRAQAMLGPIRDDIRQTLRVAWLDPGLEALAQEPVFFAAAWSAIRPSVGRSFLTLVRRLRDQAADIVCDLGPTAPSTPLPALERSQPLDPPLGEDDRARLAEAARAGHLAAAKAQLVLHLFLRAARRERTRGTGQEEPPTRRGVPEWQRWLSVLPTPDPARDLLLRAKDRLGTPDAPAALRPFARWPSALEAIWDGLEPAIASPEWTIGASAVRRTLLGGLSALPHPVELQWGVLHERGFGDGARRHVVDLLEAYDASTAGETLAAAFAWRAVGAPDLGQEA